MRFQFVRDIVLIERYHIHCLRLHLAATRTLRGCTTVVPNISEHSPLVLPYVGPAVATGLTPVVCFDEADEYQATLFRALAPAASASLPHNTVAQRGVHLYNGTPWDEIGRSALVAPDVYLRLARSAAIPVTRLNGAPVSLRAISRRPSHDPHSPLQAPTFRI